MVKFRNYKRSFILALVLFFFLPIPMPEYALVDSAGMERYWHVTTMGIELIFSTGVNSGWERPIVMILFIIIIFLIYFAFSFFVLKFFNWIKSKKS